MDQFTVPQFIDVEDKIFGPITTRQFIILLAGSLLIFLSFKLADMALFIFLTALFGGLSLTFAFVKINGQPFHYFILNIAGTARRPSLRIWQKKYSNADLKKLREANAEKKIEEAAKAMPRLSYNRIRDLSLIVNTGGYYKPE
ncbi:PrgI family protein [Patescibacteria group bacterium]|nr:MAG: PrgI family protein [Patescibacteria group bacterium]